MCDWSLHESAIREDKISGKKAHQVSKAIVEMFVG